MKTCTFSFLFALSALLLQGQSALRYNFNNTLTETNGLGPTLTVLGNQGVFVLDTLNEISGKTKTVYRFEANSGFQFDNAAAGNFLGESYTIELYFVFDNLSSWKRVVDWKNRKTDNGAYVYNGQLNFYDYVYSGQAPVLAGEYTYYVITRDGATGNLLIYTDADVQINFIDVNGDGLIDADHMLNFFFDDLLVPNEASSGAVALLNMYDYVLDSATIRLNWDHINSQVFGVSEKGKSNTSAKVFPNPASDNTAIDLSGFKNDGVVQVTVMDLMGSQVYANRIDAGNSYVINVNTLDLPSGIYMVKAESDSKISTQKLVIQR
jgi:OmpA-OmpF porin, OOP family